MERYRRQPHEIRRWYGYLVQIVKFSNINVIDIFAELDDYNCVYISTY